MNTRDSSNFDDRLDRATAARLAKLRTIPVDTSRLDARLCKVLPPPPSTAPYIRGRLLFLQPLRAAAAGLLIVGLILAAIISSSGGPVMASVGDLARVHQEMVSGQSHAVQVSSIEAAAAVLSDQWPQTPRLPDIPDDHVMACCVHEVGRKKMACVALDIDGAHVTMAVADRAEVKSPEGTTVLHDGVRYQVQSVDGVNMVMTECGGRWVCLMGRLPVDRLIESMAQLQF